MSHQTVLVIEDSHQTGSCAKQLLQNDASVPYRLLSQSPDLPIAGLCQSQQIDGIVLDVAAAPLQALSQIQQQMGQFCPPIVVIGDDAVETAVQLLKAGAADYLVRSRLTSKQLCLALQSAIAHSTSSSAISASQLDRYQHTESALQAANQKIAHILESMTDAFVALDRDWRITYINQTAARINQASPDVLIGQSHWDVWPDTRDVLEERYQNAIATQTPIHFDYFYAARQRWYEVHAYPSADGLGLYFRDIHERKQTEAALQENEERFRTLADNISQFAWMTDASGSACWYNQRWFDYTGTTPQEVQGWGWQQVHHPDHLNRVVEQFKYCLQTGEPWEDTFPLRGKDGTYRWFLSRALPIRDEDGKILRWFGTNTDITERKQAEEALAQREAELRLVTDTIPALIAFVDAEQRYRFNNHGYEDWFGQSTTEIYGKPIWEVIGDTAYEKIRPQVEQVLSGQEVSYEVQIVDKAGNTHYVNSIYVPRFSQQGEVEGFVALVSDISDRKKAEAALRDSETRFRQMTDVAPMLVWMSDVDKLCSYFNQSWLAFTGRTLDQEIGNGWTEGIHPDDFECCLQVYNTAFDARRSFEMEYRLRRFDGEYRWILDVGVPRFTPEGEFLGYLGSCFDIHDRKQAEDEREELLQREQAARETAERANRIKDEFLTVLSHELRSPLNPILGWAKLLQRRKFSEAETAQALATIERNAKLQTQLIDDLLDVARILRGKLRLNQVPLNLPSVVESAVETMRKTAEVKSITLNADVADVGQVYGDNTRLQQILWNLLSNAIKFTPSGGRVEVRLERVSEEELGSNGATGQENTASPLPPSLSLCPSYARITVTDTGKGIKPDFLQHIFESFRQEDASTTRQYGGLGLGLAIVRYLVNAHGGTITADSAGEGHGATFTVCLPLLATKTGAQKLDERLPPQDIDLAGMRILIVDDEPDARELLEMLLAQYGANIQAAASATEALSVMATFQPNLLVSDIGMPDMDGYKLIQQIRTLPAEQGGNIPAIALTAYAREVDSQQALNSGYQRHIAKPLDLERLLKAILTLSREAISS